MKTLLFCSLALFVAGGSFLIIHKTKKDPVKTALTEYHAQKNQSITIKSVEYRLCSEYTPDSLRFFTVADKAIEYGKEQTYWLGYYNERAKADSFLMLHDKVWLQASAMIDSLKSKGKGRDIFTRCNYIAAITTDKEQFSDTLTAILNEKMKVVWPN